jgi:hypothetical protein
MLSKDLLISAFIKSAFSFPKDINFDSLSKSFSNIFILFDKQSPLTSISVENVRNPTFTFGESFTVEFIIFSTEI